MRFLAWLAVLASVVVAAPAGAQSAYPSRPIRILVGFAPGGGTDVMARLIGQKLSEAWNAQVVVENRAGASGVLAADLTAKAPGDGYTLLMGHVNSHGIAPGAMPKLPYDAQRDFVPIVLVGTTPNLLVANLADSGQLVRAQAKEPVEKATAVVITFTQSGQLRIRDAHGTATLEIVAADDLPAAHPELAELGLDPVDEPLSWTAFGQLLYLRNVKLKTFLTDQTVIVGLGDLYADEILFAAGLRHDRESQSLSTQEIRRLYRALVETLHDAIKYGGTTLGDDTYLSVHGKPGDYGEHLQVVGREKLACRRCRGVITKVRFHNHTTFLCPSCQV